MGFWANVEEELNYQGITRKELAKRAEISYTGISLGLERNSMPGADTALRISKVLNVSIEYLLNGTNSENTIRHTDFFKYEELIDDIEHLPEAARIPIVEMIHKMRADFKK